MLARVAQARNTRDADLLSREASIVLEVVHASGPASRERDLVDLALLTLTETIDAADLRGALNSEFARRSMRAPERFTTPASIRPNAWS